MGGGLDNNCDNSANDCGLDSPLSAENADFLFYGQNASAAAGSSVSAAGNLLPTGKALLISAFLDFCYRYMLAVQGVPQCRNVLRGGAGAMYQYKSSHH